jgi:hypothetical protein
MNVEKTKVVRISRQPSPVQMIDQKQLENVEYFDCLGIMIIIDARFTHEIKYRIDVAKAAFSKKTTFHQQIGLMKWYSWCIALCDKANWSHTVQELPSQTCY